MHDQAPRSGLVTSLKHADVEAWRDAYAQFGRMIYGLARGMVGTADAEDVTQQAFLSAVENLAKFREEFDYWIEHKRSLLGGCLEVTDDA